MTDMSIEYAAEVLEVDPATVSEVEARNRYRTLLKAHHPDLGPENERVGREAMTTTVNAAYRWLLVHIEERDGNTPLTSIDLGDGWTFTEQAEWWPKEPYKRPRKRSRGSGPTSKTTPFSAPGVGRQRVLFGGVAIWLLSSRIDPLTTFGSLVCLVTILSLYEGRVAPIIGDVLRPIEKLANIRG
jgi:hypothetical protein